MQAIRTDEIVVTRPVSHLRKAFWACALAVSGIVGVSGGIVGLLLSLLASEGVIERNSGVRLAVPSLIVASLTAFMVFAHSMDRLQEMKSGN